MEKPLPRMCQVLFLLSAVFLLPRVASAQVRPFATGAVGGVYIDAEGVLRDFSKLDSTDRLELLRSAAGTVTDSAINQQSTLRKVSLARLEQRVQQLQDDDDELPADVRYLAGLTSVQFVFFDPKNGDVIIAGPAEGWTVAESGEVVGRESNRPVLHLDDLIVALRYAFATRPSAPFIGCSIDPTREGVEKYARYMNSLAGRFDRTRLPQILKGMGDAMGSHSVRILGVDPSSRFAHVMLAADYRLKRIAMAHDPSPVRGVTNYLDLTAKIARSPAGLTKQHRWWFVADFDAIAHSEDKLAYELQGNAMRVSTAPTSKAFGQGEKPSKSAVSFSTLFTKNIPELSQKVPVFAELQNAIALSVVAELIASQARTGTPSKSQTDDLGKVESSPASAPWKPAHFLDESACTIAQYAVPKAVPSLVNYRFIQNMYWMFSVSGGVEINTRELIDSKSQPATGNRVLLREYDEMQFPEDTTHWWWD